MSDFKCPLYNQGLYIEKITKDSAHISMCCYQRSSPTAYTDIDFDNNDYLTSIRASVNSNIPPTECSECWKLEQLKYQSYRQGEIKAQQEHNLPEYNSPVLTNLLYNCENVCNLKCIICGPQYSSLWRADYDKLGYKYITPLANKKQTKHNNLVMSLDFTHLNKIHFQGGEPFLSKDHKEVLAKAQEAGSLQNIIVSYNTNGTILPDAETIELWKQAKLVKIFFSIDAIGESFNYVRYPGNWNQVHDNIVNGFFKIADPNIVFGIGPTVNITNAFYLADIFDWVDTYIPANLQGDSTSIYVNPVGPSSEGGKVLNLNNLDVNTKSILTKHLESIPKYKDITASIINSLHSASHDSSWISYLDNVDRIRGTNWRQSLPKLSQHIS